MPNRSFDTGHPEVQRLRKGLKRLLQDAGWTVAEASSKAGINLYSVLNGGQYLRAEHIFQILDIVGASPAEFFAQLYPPPRLSVEEPRIAGVPRSELEAAIRRLVRPDALVEEEGRRKER